MKQNSLEKMLQQDAPPPDPAARVAARRAALAEFARVNRQPAPAGRGLLSFLSGALRLPEQRLLLGGAASICVAILGSMLVWNSVKHQPEMTALRTNSAPVETPRAAAQESPAATAAVPAAPVAVPAESAAARVAEPPATAKPDAAAASAESGLKVAEGARRDQGRTLAKAAGESRVELAQVQPLSSPPPAAAPPVQSGSAAAPVDAITTEKDAGNEEVVVSGMQRQPALSTNSSVATRQLDEEVVKREGPAAAHKGVPTPVRAGRSRTYFNRASGEDQKVVAVGATGAVESEGTAQPPRAAGNDKFEHFELNSIKQVADEPVSTFSADVDTSSYSFVRKQLDQGVLPQKDAVRAEEMVNYFEYAWPAAESRDKPFRPTVVVTDSPWNKGRKLIHIGIKGYALPASTRPDANLVMLLDVSGSMDEPDKLPLVKQSMKLLLGSLKPTDTVGIVVYAGEAGMVLPPTKVAEKEKIVAALDSLTPGGSTAGAEGIELAYQLAEKSFRKEGVNRILLCTDGDFNVGIAGTEELKGYVERKRASGIFLSVLGFGQGNYRDELAQALAQNGNGVAAYIDTLNEAQKVLVQEAGASLFTIAKDVKFQVEFNPATVAEYRLVGYETRALKKEDFNNDKVDAGDVGSGHAVTAIYEITPVGAARSVDESRYAPKKPAEPHGSANEYGFLKMRYKLPEASSSQLVEVPIKMDAGRVPEDVARDVGFSTAVAGFAQLLRGGQFTGSLTYDDVIKQALVTRGEDPYGYRSEFVQLVRKAQAASGK